MPRMFSSGPWSDIHYFIFQNLVTFLSSYLSFTSNIKFRHILSLSISNTFSPYRTIYPLYPKTAPCQPCTAPSERGLGLKVYTRSHLQSSPKIDIFWQKTSNFIYYRVSLWLSDSSQYVGMPGRGVSCGSFVSFSFPTLTRPTLEVYLNLNLNNIKT